MKKAIIIAVCMLVVPALALAMEPISTQEMDAVTGQAGVSIALDDVKIYMHLGSEQLWYQDGDGVSGTNGASVGIQFTGAAYSMIDVNALKWDTTAGAFTSPGTAPKGTYVSDYNTDFAATTPSALTIDVTSQLPVMSMATATPVAGVNIGLPTLEVYLAEGSKIIMDIAISKLADPTTDPNPASFGTIYNDAGGLTLAVLDGSLEIAPH